MLQCPIWPAAGAGFLFWPFLDFGGRNVAISCGTCRASTAATASSSAARRRTIQRPLGRLGRRRQRRRLRRPDRRRLDADPNGNDSGASYVVFGKAAGFAANIDLSTPRRHRRLQAHRRGGVRLQRLLGRLGRRRQRRRLRRPDRRRPMGRPERHPMPARATWCSARPSGFAANIDLSALDGSQRLQAQRRGGGRLERLLGRLGRRRQRRRLRRPDRRRASVPTRTAAHSGASYVVFGKASGFAANIDLSTPRRHDGFRLTGAAADD